MIEAYEIYLITGPECWYVGSTTVGAQKRFERHMTGKGGAPRLKAKVAELGPEAFQQIIIEEDFGDPIEAEQRWYDWYLANDLRQTLNAKRPDSWDGFSRGKSLTPQHRRHISEANMGRVPTPETRIRLSEGHKGISPSSDTKAKLSAANKGKKNALGHKQSNEHRAKSSETHHTFPRSQCQCGRSFTPWGLANHIKVCA
jgi:hypothetical protein